MHSRMKFSAATHSGASLVLVFSLVTILGSAALGQSLTPNPLSFSPLGVGSQSRTKQMKLTAAGTTLHISSITISGDFQIQSGDCGTTLPPFASCHLNIVFAPTMLGLRTGVVTVTDDAPNSPQTATVKGTGVAPVTISPATYTFHDELSGSSSGRVSFQVFNNSSSPVTLSSEGTTGDFQIVNNFCGTMTLQPYGGTCGVNVIFSPAQVGRRTGTLVINDNAPNNPQVANLSGNSVTITTLRHDVFTGVFPLNTDRAEYTSTLLDNGKVLIAGGAGNSVELYDPGTGGFTYTGNTIEARSQQAATLLPNGKVLITGGSSNTVAELYDPVSGTFAATGSMTMPRYLHSSTLLDNGQVLIVGGGSGNVPFTAEVYDPSTGIFSAVGNLNSPRPVPVATLLNNGKVLISGGFEVEEEVYDPTTQTFTVVGQTLAPAQTATLLNNGTVLLTEGDRNVPQTYDPVTNTFTSTGNTTVPRRGPLAALLTNGTVLAAGGSNHVGQFLYSTDLYNPVSRTFHGGPPMGFTNLFDSQISIDVLVNADVLVTGTSGQAFRHDAEIYTPSALTPANLVSITVTPANGGIAVGSAEKFIATGRFSDNSVQQLSSVIWSSSNSAVATIANDSGSRGWAFGASPGMVTITARAGTVSGSTTLTVH